MLGTKPALFDTLKLPYCCERYGFARFDHTFFFKSWSKWVWQDFVSKLVFSRKTMMQ